MGTAQLADIEREIARSVSGGYLLEESPLYRNANESNGPARSRAAWIRAARESGLERDTARTRVDAAIQGGSLVPREPRYSTQTALEREKRVLQIERDGRDQVIPIIAIETARSHLGAADLTSGQRAAGELILTTADRVVGVQGYAGTGKSHMLEHTKAIAEEHGHNVVALAPYATQVRALRELGVEARTLASFLAAREKRLDSRTVLVIDEAGTVPTRQMEQVLKLAETANARVVLLGDTRQTKAIEAGRPFDQLQTAGMVTALMDEIQRQKDATLREAVALAAAGEAAASLARIRAVHEIPDDKRRHAVIADDYARMPAEERGTTIIVADTNEARREINALIRERLGTAGQGRVFDTLVRRDTTQAGRLFAKNYNVGDVVQPERDYPRRGLKRGQLYEVLENGPANHLTVRTGSGEVITFNPYTNRKLSVYEPERAELAPGDRVRITRNDAALDLANGDRATVRSVSPEAVTIALDDQRLLELRADKQLHLDLAYATTVHSSQGTTAERVLIDASTKSRTTAKDVYYVAISRAQLEARIYTDDARTLPAAVARENVKYAGLDLIRDGFANLAAERR
jgi:ATP-dependent exoDNAse (exonuclease V) alpha subunit